MEALGREFDISIGNAPVDYNTAGATGKRVSLRNATGCTILVVVGAAASGTESLVLTLKQHTASTGGTSANLATCDHWYIKAATTLAGTEQWLRVSQSASQTITVSDSLTTTGSATSLSSVATKQALIAIEVGADQLSDTYAYVSLDVADPGSASRLGAVLYILHDLNVQRRATSLAASLA